MIEKVIIEILTSQYGKSRQKMATNIANRLNKDGFDISIRDVSKALAGDQGNAYLVSRILDLASEVTDLKSQNQVKAQEIKAKIAAA